MDERDIIIDLDNPQDVEDIHKVQRVYASIGSLLLSYTLRTLLIAFLFTFIVSNFLSIEEFSKNMGMISVLMQVPISIYCTYYIVSYAKLRMHFDTSILRNKTLCSVKVMVVCTIMVLGLNVGFSFLSSAIELLFNQAGVAFVTPDFSYQSNMYYNIMLIVLTVVIAPITEEILFRGIILTSLKPYGKKFSIVISAVLFAMLHGNLTQAIPTLAIGCVLGYVAYESNSIVPSIIIHALQNAIVMVFAFLAMYEASIIVLFVLHIMLIICTLFFLWKYRKVIFVKEKPILSGAGYTCFFTRMPIIVVLVYYGVNMILSFSSF